MNKSGSFRTSGQGFSGIDADVIRTMVAHSADYVVVLSPDLHVQAIHFGTETLGTDILDGLQGTLFEATLTPESLNKFAALIDGARADDPPRWRQLNHIDGTHQGAMPVRYAAMQASDGNVVLMGRDKRELAALQQRQREEDGESAQSFRKVEQVIERFQQDKHRRCQQAKTDANRDGNQDLGLQAAFEH